MTMTDMVKTLGADIAKSGLFGCENESQGRVLAMACIVGRIDPLKLPQTYHLVKGKLSMRSDAMLGQFSLAGGTYDILERSCDAAEIAVSYKGRSYRQRFTWDMAKQEPFVYAGGKEVTQALAEGKPEKLKISVNYSTPHKRMQMLWARVVSDCIRTIAPEIVCGAYSPAEIADYSGSAYSDSTTMTVVNPTSKQAAPEVVTPAAAATAAETRTVADVVDAECEPIKQLDLATPEQLKAINAMFDSLAMSAENRAASIAKRGCKLLEEMPTNVAAELLDALTKRHAEIAKHSKPSEAETSKIAVEGPITKELLDSVVDEFKAAAQRDSGLVERVRTKLVESNMKLSDLTYEQGRKLLIALKGEAVEAFFQMPLVKDLKVEPIASDDPAPDV